MLGFHCSCPCFFFLSKTIIYGFFCFKDVTLKERNSYLVYKFMCSCSNAIYLGESEKHPNICPSERLGIAPYKKESKKPQKVTSHSSLILIGLLCQFWRIWNSFKRKQHLNHTFIDKTCRTWNIFTFFPRDLLASNIFLFNCHYVIYFSMLFSCPHKDLKIKESLIYVAFYCISRGILLKYS